MGVKIVELRQALNDLNAARSQLQTAQSDFVEAAVLQITACEAKVDALFRELKKNGDEEVVDFSMEDFSTKAGVWSIGEAISSVARSIKNHALKLAEQTKALKQHDEGETQ